MKTVRRKVQLHNPRCAVPPMFTGVALKKGDQPEKRRQPSPSGHDQIKFGTLVWPVRGYASGMAVGEILAVAVGSAVAKAILKVWLKDTPLASEVSTSLVDVLKRHTDDLLGQRRGEREFAAIGERVAESVLPIFEMEGRNLEEGSKEAVAIAVAGAIEKTSITPDLLASINIDASMLAKSILSNRPPESGLLSERESALFDRVVAELSVRICDIASHLPSFSERTLGEILRRENYLIALVLDLLKEVQRIHLESKQFNLQMGAAHFEAEYRLAVVRRLDELQLFGVEVSTASKRHGLSIAYISLSLTCATNGAGARPHSAPPLPAKNADRALSAAATPVNEVLRGAHHLLVQGQAGSGKTTLLQWIAVRSAARNFPEELGDLNDTIPFFIRLRHYARGTLPTPEAFVSEISGALLGSMPSGWVHDRLRSGNALVLVDGLDEVAQEDRAAVREWLNDLVASFPAARFIVTARAHAVDSSWTAQPLFVRAELQPMEMADISLFLDHWHEAVRQALSDEAEQGELVALNAELKLQLRERQHLRGLATSPLLCAMICALNRERHQHLPSDRIELYEACCQLLLERRDVERRVELRDYPRLTYRQKRALLDDFAYWLVENGWSEIETAKVDARFDLRLTAMDRTEGPVTGAEVRRLFVERSGVLRQPVIGVIDFTHRTFQEYMAAQASVDEGNIGVLIKNATDDQWRELIILAAGLAGQTAREELIGGLLERGDTQAAVRQQVHLLAVACLETSEVLDSGIRESVQSRLSALVPPRNVTEAKELASAGDLAVPFLRNKGKFYAQGAASSVRALTVIGSEAAFSALETYKLDGRRTVLAELFRGWDFFDKADYAQRILAFAVTKNPVLEFDRMLSFEAFQYLSSLQSLLVKDCHLVTDITALSELTNLEKLALFGCTKLEELSAIFHLAQLTSLILTGLRTVRDIDGLQQLGELRGLLLSNLTRISLEPLLGTELDTLSLSGRFDRMDLTPLRSITPKRDFKLTYERPENLRGVGEAATLRTLRILGGNLEGLQGVEEVSPTLREIELRLLARLTDVSSLRHLAGGRLFGITFYRCDSLEDLSPLAELQSLSRVQIQFCPNVRKLDFLLNLPKLRSVRLVGSPRARDAGVLRELQKRGSIIVREG
jgi:hypothetical protein